MNINRNQININYEKVVNELPADILKAGEFFAGGGGWTTGLDDVDGIETVWILNHDKDAIRTNSHHHKNVQVFWADVYAQDEHELMPVDYVHASIECTQHSNANGGKEKKIGSYTMGWELYRYLKFLNPLFITIENVPEFKKWAPLDQDGQPDKKRIGEEFERWKNAIIALGYDYKETIRNAADDGLPTRRVRYFGFFFKPGIEVTIPEFTHSKSGTDGKLKHKPCRPHINTDDHGQSIFGRQFNFSLPKHHRKPVSPNTQRRIAGGIKKYSPEFHQFLTQYYGGENFNRFQSLEQPINTIPTENRHQLVTLEKLKFIMDYCRSDNFNLLEEPLNPQLTRQTKQYVEIDNFLCQYYGSNDQQQSLDIPINTVPCRDTHQLVRLEKMQFIAKYFNSNGNPETNIQSLDTPLSTILRENKHQLVTILDDFDIKVRFLKPEELGACTTFPKGYFTDPNLKLSHKKAVRMIGNAVPPKWASVLMLPNIKQIQAYKQQKLSA